MLTSSSGHRGSARGGRAAGVFGLIVIVELLALVGFGAWMLRRARSDLEQARDHASDGRAAVSELDLVAAQASFDEASADFERAGAALGHPVVRALRIVPTVGDDLRTVEALAVSGGIVATAAGDVLTVVNDAPDGLQSLLPSDGGFPVALLGDLADAADAARRQLRDAAATVDAAPDDALYGPVARARDEFEGQLGEATGLVDDAADVSRALVTFLGDGGRRRYLFGAQNPAELRGTGGYIGAYAVATFDRGGLELSRFVPIQQLTSLPISDVAPPSADYAARYNRYGGAGFWPAINATPDFPSAAQAMVRLYERTEQTRLDGVIVVDPFALESLLRIVGDIRVPGIGTVGPADVVDVVSNRAYAQFDDPTERKEVLGAVAATALRRLLAGDADPGAGDLLDVLVPMARDRHVMLYDVEPDVQHTWEDMDLAGALPAPRGDTVALIVNNASINKVDFYVDRRVEYRVRLRRDGSAAARLRATFRNDAPARGPGRYVLGPQLDDLRAGDDLSLVSVFCGRCDVTGSHPPLTDAGPASGAVLERELGHTVATSLVTVHRGRQRRIGLSWELDDAWSPEGDGCYRLTYLAQTTLGGTSLRVVVEPPDGYASSAGRTLHEGAAVGRTTMKSCYVE